MTGPLLHPRRTISHTELEALYRCQARWDFAYGDQLVGSSLKPKGRADVLAEGSAWGAGVYAWHATGSALRAEWAIARSLAKDARKLKAAGLYVRDAHREMFRRLCRILDHYVEHTPRLSMSRGEERLSAPVGPYDFEGYLDGVADDGEPWPVEFKLRWQLSSFDAIQRSPQLRRYAWLWMRVHGAYPAGIIVDERVNGYPEPAAPVAYVKPKRKGETPPVGKRQSCTPDAYVAACDAIGQAPEPEVVEALAAKHDPGHWHRRHRLHLTKREIDEAGRELASAALLVAMLDGGRLFPVRNPGWGARNCSGCPFAEPCLDPRGTNVIEALFDRVPSKTNRPAREAA